MLENSTVLVSGGAGHIGSHIVDELLKENVKKIIVYDNLCEGRVSNLANDSRIELIRRDIRDREDLSVAMKGVDYVIHTASVLLLECRDHPDKAIDINIRGTYNVIKASIDAGVKKLIFSSSGSVYGEPIKVPMNEEHPYNSETFYGTTKITGEHLLIDHYRSSGLQFVGLRYFNVYGPRQHYKGAYAQIIPRWVDRIFANEPLVIFGDGSQTMDMTYVTDIAKANVLALKSDVTHDFVNVGTGNQWSILQLANMMKEITGHNLPYTFIPQDVNLVKRRQCSTEKAKELIGFEYKVNVYDGLKMYYEWRKNLEDIVA